MSKLYLVGTPIGNLEDITERAKKVLQKADLVLAEEVQRTQQLLKGLQIENKVVRYHQHSGEKKKEKIKGWLKDGYDLALVTSAGTPGLSDPGNELVIYLREQKKDFSIIPIPGVSALTTAISVCGFPMDEFSFLGFPPKKKRTKFFDRLFEYSHPVVLFESCHRIIKTLKEILSRNPEQEVFVGRELTKKFESLYYGDIVEVIDQLRGDKIKGEFVIIINNPSKFN